MRSMTDLIKFILYWRKRIFSELSLIKIIIIIKLKDINSNYHQKFIFFFLMAVLKSLKDILFSYCLEANCTFLLLDIRCFQVRNLLFMV